MNFLKGLGNFTLIIFWMSVAIAPVVLLIGGAVATTVWAALHFGTVASIAELKNSLTVINVVIEVTALIVTLTLLAFALKKIWNAFSISFNGFVFGIAFASLLSLIITIRLSIFAGYADSLVNNFAIFGIIFALLFAAGLKVIPPRHRALLVFFNFLGKQELKEGLAWKLPLFSKFRLFDMSSQKIELIRKSDDLSMDFLNITKFKKLEISFMYQLKKNNLHNYLKVDIQHKIESIIDNTIPKAFAMLDNSIIFDQGIGSHFMTVITNPRKLIVLLSYGTFFPSTKDFPELLKNSFWQKRVCETFDSDYLIKQGYSPKIVAKEGNQCLEYVDIQGNKPENKIMEKLSSIKTKYKIDYVIKNNLEICVFNELERNTLASHGFIKFIRIRGVFEQVMELGILPKHLGIMSIEPTDQVQREIDKKKDDLMQKREEEIKKERKLEKIKSYFSLIKDFKKQGLSDSNAINLAANLIEMKNLGSIFNIIKNEKFFENFLTILNNKGGHKK